MSPGDVIKRVRSLDSDPEERDPFKREFDSIPRIQNWWRFLGLFE